MTQTTHGKVGVYGQNQKTALVETASGNSRETDARALLACAWRIDDAKKQLAANLKSKDALKQYGDAIRHNQRLWTIFQVALSDPQNPLPQDLKILLMNLSRYVDKTSFRAVGKYTPEAADSLININRMIAVGLSKPVAGQSLPPVPAMETREMPTTLMTSA